LYLEDVLYNNGSSSEEWVCELPRKESSELGLQYVEIDRSDTVISREAVSGESIVSMSRAIVDTEDQRMYIPTDARVKLHNQFAGDDIPRVPRNRVLAAKTGTLQTLVIRIIDRNGVAPTASIDQLQNDFFDDDSCLKSQFEACSYGKLQIEPFSGTTETGLEINHGVVDVVIDLDVSTSTRTSLQQAAMKDAAAQLGDLGGEQYGLVAYTMPPGGSDDWVAFAFVTGKFSFFNDVAASAVSFQLHEIGHNLGLAHSGTEGKQYNDKTGMMGISIGEDDFHRCYNPAKSYQLGWYDDKVQTINPFSTENPVNQFVLNGVSDYLQNDEALVVLRLEQTEPQLQQDYYVGYNRQEGINKDTFEDKNMVTIIRKESGAPTEYGKSIKVASLYLGQSFTIKNFNNERDVRIEFAGLSNDNPETVSPIRDAVIRVVDVENDPDISVPKVIPCENHVFEVGTDNYPDDNAFVVVLDNAIGEMVAESPVLTEPMTTYTIEACLPYQQNYKFIIYDKFEDGICCGQGRGFYRAMDSQGNVLFDSNKQNEGFNLKIEFFKVGENPNPDDDIDDGTVTLQPSSKATAAPTSKPPTKVPTEPPTGAPSSKATAAPTSKPPTKVPTEPPTGAPSSKATAAPTSKSPTKGPTIAPSVSPTTRPPSKPPTPVPTGSPVVSPTTRPPSKSPTKGPTVAPTPSPTTRPPSKAPTKNPTIAPSVSPTTRPPSKPPTKSPTVAPTPNPTTRPPSKPPTKGSTIAPSVSPTTRPPSKPPTKSPTVAPTPNPTTRPPSKPPTKGPTVAPTPNPTTRPPSKPPTKGSTVAPSVSPTTRPPSKPPTKSPTIAPMNNLDDNIKCKDKTKKKLKWKSKGKGKKKKCKWIAKKKKCDVTYKDKPLWQTCPKSCGRCTKM